MGFSTTSVIVQKNILSNEYISLYGRLDPALGSSPDQGALNVMILVDNNLDIITLHLVFSNICWSREEDFLGF